MRPLVRSRALIAVVLAALMTAGDAGAKKAPKGPDPSKAHNPQELQIVDCLLPGQIRQLGRQQTFVSRRRPVRTSALDCEIRGGEYVAYDRANYQTALKVWLETAEAGDAKAQYYVGEIYEKGLGTAPDYAQAAAWYKKAADQGLAQAQINLGFLCEKGLGVPQDQKQALDWYRKATGVSGSIVLDSEMDAIRKELAAATEQLAQASAGTESLERELTETQQKLAAAEAAGQRSEAEAAALKRRTADLATKLAADRKQIATLKESVKRYDVAGPTIEIVDTATVRSGAPAPAPGAGEELVGRVEAPAGLAEVTADGDRQKVDEGGFFRFRPHGRRITIVAVDRQGKRGQLVHDLDAKAAAPAIAASSRRPAKSGSYHALVIGNSNYRDLPVLSSAVNDATTIRDVLQKRYGFKVTLLQDASYMDVLAAFSTLREQLTEKDNLLIYFAGHGEIDAATGQGYWLPVDAQKSSKANWISSREISLQLELLSARHVLVIADSCYSGALTRTALARVEPDPDGRHRLSELATKRSRTALTSGGLAPVLDAGGGGGHSIFARSLLAALSRPTDTVDTYMLWSSVKARVMYDTRALREQQVPEYAPIQYAGHEGGEFFFVPVSG